MSTVFVIFGIFGICERWRFGTCTLVREGRKASLQPGNPRVPRWQIMAGTWRYRTQGRSGSISPRPFWPDPESWSSTTSDFRKPNTLKPSNLCWSSSCPDMSGSESAALPALTRAGQNDVYRTPGARFRRQARLRKRLAVHPPRIRNLRRNPGVAQIFSVA